MIWSYGHLRHAILVSSMQPAAPSAQTRYWPSVVRMPDSNSSSLASRHLNNYKKVVGALKAWASEGSWKSSASWPPSKQARSKLPASSRIECMSQ